VLLCLDDAEEIIVTVMKHVDEYDSSVVSGKRPYVKIIATSLLDNEIYDVMMDMPTRQFDFIVKIREYIESNPKPAVVFIYCSRLLALEHTYYIRAYAQQL